MRYDKGPQKAKTEEQNYFRREIKTEIEMYKVFGNYQKSGAEILPIDSENKIYHPGVDKKYTPPGAFMIKKTIEDSLETTE